MRKTIITKQNIENEKKGERQGLLLLLRYWLNKHERICETARK